MRTIKTWFTRSVVMLGLSVMAAFGAFMIHDVFYILGRETTKPQPTNVTAISFTNSAQSIKEFIVDNSIDCLKAGWRAGAAGISQAEMLQQFTNRVVRVLP